MKFYYLCLLYKMPRFAHQQARHHLIDNNRLNFRDGGEKIYKHHRRHLYAHEIKMPVVEEAEKAPAQQEGADIRNERYMTQEDK